MKKTETLADLGMNTLAEEMLQRPILGRHFVSKWLLVRC